jgi:CheY-like chemotaxis protein
VHHPQPKIFFVEDDPDDRFLMLQAFHEIGCSGQVQFFASSEGFYKHIVHTKEALPRLIVLDFNMPTINGGELLLRLRHEAHLRHIPVIIISTGMHPVLEETLLSYGAEACFLKGMMFGDFLALASRLMEFVREAEPIVN